MLRRVAGSVERDGEEWGVSFRGGAEGDKI
jgi:hypothetical protein